MTSQTLNINGESRDIPPAWQSESLLFVLREYLGLVGTKFGCGAGLCGACTVLVDGQPRRSCLLPANLTFSGQVVETIEGLAAPGQPLHPVQQAWVDAAVPQCGYCQAGQIMTAVALIRNNPDPTSDEVDSAMAGNLCRCGTQDRIRGAVLRAAEGAS